MPYRDEAPPTDGLMKQVQPLFQLAGMVVGIVIWSYSTFALKETVNELRTTVASQKLELMTYSDNNRHRMEERTDAVLVDIRDQLTYLRTLMKRL